MVIKMQRYTTRKGRQNINHTGHSFITMRDTLKVQNIYVKTVKNYQKNENVNNNGSKIKTMFLAPNIEPVC